jgi:hypothetical protein
VEQSPFKTKKFLDLQDKWYNKLKKKGFNDIEDTTLPEPPLKSWDNFRYKKVTPEEYEAKTKYYSNCRDILLTYRFSRALHKRIWELHSEGLSLREIEREIKDKYKKDTINKIIQKIELEAMPK